MEDKKIEDKQRKGMKRLERNWMNGDGNHRILSVYNNEWREN